MTNKLPIWSHSSQFTTQEQAVLQDAMNIIARYWATRSSDVFTSPDLVKAFCQMHLAHVEREVFGALWLDQRHRLLDVEDLFAGTVNQAIVQAREVLRSGLKVNASAVIFYHNHPSGCPEPSQADRQLTQYLSTLLEPVDVRVLDHMVVSLSGVVSFAERGWC